MKITRYMLVVVSLLVVGLLMNAGCKKGVQGDTTDLEDAGTPAGDTSTDEDAFTVKEVALVLPSQEELGVDSKRISRHSKIKISYEGELPSDVGLKLGDDDVEYTVLSDADGELLIKPKMPMHNLKTYKLGDFSFKVKAPGDVNGDGKSDIVAGAPTHSEVGYRGAAFIFLGDEFPAKWLYAQWYDDESVVSIFDDDLDDKFGTALALGDLNGDGYDDIAIGAPGENSGRGCVYLIYGGAELQQTIKVFTSSDSKICRSPSASYSGNFGASLAIGDLNGDGFGDLIVGEPLSRGRFDSISQLEDAGAARTFFGGAAGLESKNIDATHPADGDYYATTSFQMTGSSVAAGDLNGDGLDDVMIGAPGSDELPSHPCRRGKAFMDCGAADLKETGAAVIMESLSDIKIEGDVGCYSGNTKSDRFGRSVAVMSGEDKETALIAARNKAYMYKHEASAPTAFFTASIVADLTIGWLGEKIGIGQPVSSYVYLADREGVVEQTPLMGDLGFGVSLSAAGDIDGNGSPDFIIGEDEGPALDQGAVHVYTGGTANVIAGKSHALLGTAVAGGTIR